MSYRWLCGEHNLLSDRAHIIPLHTGTFFYKYTLATLERRECKVLMDRTWEGAGN